jgi:inhibitor of cysteine peptidase
MTRSVMAMTRSILFFALLIFCSALVSARSGVSEGSSAFAACVAAGKGAEVTSMAVAAEEGQEFAIFLDSNRTTGYEWRLAAPIDERVVHFVRSEYAPPKGGLVGAGGREEWTFLAKGRGETEILLEYVRPWEEGKPPAARAHIRVSVKPAP